MKMMKTKYRNGIALRALMTLMALDVMPVKAQDVYRLDKPTAGVQLHTNTLYDLILSPSIGIEVQTDLGIAWQLDYVGAWWNSTQSGKFFSDYAFQTELRYYLSSRYLQRPFTGHHVGVYGQLVTFDFTFGNTGYQSPNLDNTYGIGLAYGYAKPISKNMALDFTIGLGYFSSKYTVYEVTEDLMYRITAKKHLTFIGPTRLEVSLVWNINKKNKQKRYVYENF
jgi:hypothetical protein